MPFHRHEPEEKRAFGRADAKLLLLYEIFASQFQLKLALLIYLPVLHNSAAAATQHGPGSLALMPPHHPPLTVISTGANFDHYPTTFSYPPIQVTSSLYLTYTVSFPLSEQSLSISAKI